MKKRFITRIAALLVMICMIVCLAACGEEDDDPKAGKTRDGKTTVTPTEAPEPTDEPTPDPTPTAEPTPTATPTPTPTPEPTLSGYAAALQSFFGNWVSDDNIAITIRPGSDLNSVEVVCGSWYDDTVGLYQEDNAPSVLKVIGADVDVNARKAEVTVSHTTADQDFIFSMSEVSAFDFNLQINHSITRHFEKTEKTPRAKEDELAFFQYYQGIWSDTGSYDFALIGYNGKKDLFYVSFNTYASEWLPAYDIIKIVPGPKTGDYVLVNFIDYNNNVFPFWMFWDINNKGDLELTYVDDGAKYTCVKGVTYSGSKSLEDPNIFDAAALPNDFANIYLGGYDVAKLKEIWASYITHEIPGESVTFTDPSYGYSITVYYDASGKGTECKTTK